MSTVCVSAKCGNYAHWTPVLFLSPQRKGETMTQAELGLPLCHKHMLGAKLTDLLTPEAWHQMEDMFAERGKRMPNRRDIALHFKGIFNGLISPSLEASARSH